MPDLLPGPRCRSTAASTCTDLACCATHWRRWNFHRDARAGPPAARAIGEHSALPLRRSSTGMCRFGAPECRARRERYPACGGRTGRLAARRARRCLLRRDARVYARPGQRGHAGFAGSEIRPHTLPCACAIVAALIPWEKNIPRRLFAPSRALPRILPVAGRYPVEICVMLRAGQAKGFDGRWRFFAYAGVRIG